MLVEDEGLASSNSQPTGVNVRLFDQDETKTVAEVLAEMNDEITELRNQQDLTTEEKIRLVDLIMEIQQLKDLALNSSI